jgi:hypothetical protein
LTADSSCRTPWWDVTLTFCVLYVSVDSVARFFLHLPRLSCASFKCNESRPCCAGGWIQHAIDVPIEVAIMAVCTKIRINASVWPAHQSLRLMYITQLQHTDHSNQLLARSLTVALGIWSSGMILRLGRSGRRFDSGNPPFLSFIAKKSLCGVSFCTWKHSPLNSCACVA